MTDAGKSTLTQSTLKAALQYDSITGVFTWAVARGGVRRGDVAGCRDDKGYVLTRRPAPVHVQPGKAVRLVLTRVNLNEIDHRNRIKHDNRIDNLRESDPVGNGQNKDAQANNTSGHRGVTWNKARRKWRAFIRHDGLRTYLGSFDTKEAAADAYRAASLRLHQFTPFCVGVPTTGAQV